MGGEKEMRKADSREAGKQEGLCVGVGLEMTRS